MSKRFLKHFWVLSLITFSCLPSTALAAEALKLVPNDTFYNWQWGMDYIHAPQAWAQIQNSSISQPVSASDMHNVVVAMIDGGVDFTHPDLKGALWTNPDEMDDGKDNDGDGLVGDLHGWNFVTNSTDTRPLMKTSLYFNGAWEHGTAVASLIAGRGNDDIGLAGVAWKAKIMPLVILGADGVGSAEHLVQAIRYAIAHRADIINLSLEGDTNDGEVGQAITEATARGILVVIAAGNGLSGGVDLDEQPQYPSCYQGAAGQSVLVVSAIQEDGSRNPSTNYGQCVNIAAPGAEILSARPIYDQNGQTRDVSGYGTLGGTSLAAPLVSGVAALLKVQHPDWMGEQLAQRILDTVQPFAEGVDVTGLGQGVLDAGAATSLASEHDTTVSSATDEKYGPWKLLASNPGTAPYVWVTDEQNRTVLTFPVGDSADKRGLRAVFVHWDRDRKPDVMVTAQGDEAGAWRVYRWDGVLLAAGQINQETQSPPDKVGIKGGLLLAAQDLGSKAREEILLTEASGPRAWRLNPEDGLSRAFWVTLDNRSFGTLAVGVQRPNQAMLLLSRSLPYASLEVLRDSGLGEGAAVTTTQPANLKMMEGRTLDGREVVRLTQSGKPTYLVERGGTLAVTHDPLEVSVWYQAPLGLAVSSTLNALFYDFWPR